MAGAERLYTPELLGLAVSLADYPPAPGYGLHGSASSRSCGSTLAMDLDLNPDGRVQAIGLQVRACAVGQAAAALFARSVAGRDPGKLCEDQSVVASWVAGSGDLPDWPGLALLEEARKFPARHGAIMLPWNAAVDALSTPDDGG